MFQYTSETIINSNEGALELVNAAGTGYDAGVRFAAVTADGKDAVATSGTADSLIVDGVLAVKACDVKRAWKTAYVAPEMAKVTVTVPTVAKGDEIQLRVYLSEQGRSSSLIQNAKMRKSRVFTYAVVAPSATADDSAALLVKQIKAEMAQTDFKYFKASATGAVITLEGLDCYVRFADKNGVIVPVGGSIAETLRIEAAANGAITPVAGSVVALGSEGAGTVAQLIKNLRVPTSASTDPFHGDHGGMPIPGGKYDQYLVEVEVDRRHVGGAVVGMLSTSVTSHVFFVLQGTTESTAFEAVLNKVLAVNSGSVKAAGIPATAAGVRSGKRTDGVLNSTAAAYDATADMSVANAQDTTNKVEKGEAVLNKKA